MIKSFQHKGLELLFRTGSTKGVQAAHANKLRRQLSALDHATKPDDLDLSGWRLHPLKGRAKGRWSLTVNGNWRVTFEFKDSDAYVIDYEDYH